MAGSQCFFTGPLMFAVLSFRNWIGLNRERLFVPDVPGLLRKAVPGRRVGLPKLPSVVRG